MSGSIVGNTYSFLFLGPGLPRGLGWPSAIALNGLFVPAFEPPVPFLRPSTGTCRLDDVPLGVSVLTSVFDSEDGGESLLAAVGVAGDDDGDDAFDGSDFVIGFSCGNLES